MEEQREDEEEGVEEVDEEEEDNGKERNPLHVDAEMGELEKEYMNLRHQER